MSYERLHQYFEGCVTLYKDFVKQLSANNRKSLRIVVESNKNAGGTKRVTFPPDNFHYNSNKWYTLRKNEKEKGLKACSKSNGGKNSTKSVGQPNSGGGSNNGHGNVSLKFLCLRRS